MDDIKEKLLIAVQDGALDGADVVERLLCYLDEDTIQEIIDGEGWDEACGLSNSDTSDEDY